jgi:hypothetical protein
MHLAQHHLVILKRIMFVIAILTCGVAFGAPPASTPADPCLSSSVAKKSVPISTSTLDEALLVPASSRTIHVCGFLVQGGGAFVYGALFEGSPCGSSRTDLTGFLQATGGPATTFSHGGAGTIFTVPANQSLCWDPVIDPTDGILTYTQL